MASVTQLNERNEEIRSALKDLEVEHAGEAFDDETKARWNALNEELVANDELVTELEAPVAEIVRHDASGRTVEQRARRNPSGPPLAELPQEIRERETGVDQVLHYHHVAPADVRVQIVEDPDPTGVRGEPRDRHEVELDRDPGDRAGQVGDEQQRALQHADEHDAVGMIGLDLRREAADVAGNGVGVEQDRRGHVSP